MKLLKHFSWFPLNREKAIYVNFLRTDLNASEYLKLAFELIRLK